MSVLTTRRLRALFSSLRKNTTDDIAYQSMQRLLPPDPNTGEPYNADEIWAWLNGADNTEIEDRLNYWGGDFVQTVSYTDQYGRTGYYSFRMELERGHDLLHLLTSDEGKKKRLSTALNIMRNRYQFRGQLQLEEVRPLDRYSGKAKELVMLPENYEELDEEDFEEVDPYYYDGE